MVSCNVSCWVPLVSVFLRMLNSGDGDLQTVLLDGVRRQMSKACIDGSDSLTFQHKRRPSVSKYAVAIWPVTGQGFQNTKWPAVLYSQ